MRDARTALDELSQDPETFARARRRADDIRWAKIIHDAEIEEANTEARAQGRDEGLREGPVDGMRDALLALVEARSLVISDATKTRLAAQANPSVLSRRLHEVAVVASEDANELFANA